MCELVENVARESVANKRTRPLAHSHTRTHAHSRTRTLAQAQTRTLAAASMSTEHYLPLRRNGGALREYIWCDVHGRDNTAGREDKRLCFVKFASEEFEPRHDPGSITCRSFAQ